MLQTSSGTMPRDSDYEWLNTKQAAYLMGKAKRTLDAWRQQGKGPPYYQDGATGRVRYRRRDVIEWIEKQRRG